MDKTDYIKKWLDGTLTADEKRAFELTDDYRQLIRMDNALQSFKAPAYDKQSAWEELSEEKNQSKIVPIYWLRPLSGIAAIFVIVLGISLFFMNYEKTYVSGLGEKLSVDLPDGSRVLLSAKSELKFSKIFWDMNRQVSLDGEAYFDVATGARFDVLTDAGTVSVLGTQFNVKQRGDFFEVTCYEGLVSVVTTQDSLQLHPGHLFRKSNGSVATIDLTATKPAWIGNKSSFISVPYAQVLDEFERYFEVSIEAGGIDTSRLFTGQFTHDDMEQALRTITLPMRVSYSFSDNQTIVLTETLE